MNSEIDIFKQFRQVIVWGFPLHSHTHSYIHGAWVKTFQYLGIPVHWFHDGSYPQQFDYTNTCFITEGWADNNIPIESTSTYFLHIATNPAKYLDKGARLIEIRYHVLEINDYNYYYKIPESPIYISKDTLYEIVPNDSAVAAKRGRSVSEKPYEVIYMHWATDLLPHEFNYEDTAPRHNRVIHYLGTVGPTHPFNEFRRYAEQSGFNVIHNCPWNSPVSYEENIKRMKESYCSPDFRSHGDHDKFLQYGKMNGSNHVDIGYIPCRVLKAISYGHTGITNSKRVKELLGEYVEYAEDPSHVLPIVEKRKNDVEWRKQAMKHIAEHHTYIQRVRDLARVLSIKNTKMTCVTSMYDIQRERIDGRSLINYKEWLYKTVQSLYDPVVLYLDPTLNWKNDIIRARNSIGPMVIYELSFSQTMMWKYKQAITDVLNNPEFKQKQLHPNDITNLIPEYCMIQYNKFDFLDRTITANPFSSTVFSWMDAGISRFLNEKRYIHNLDGLNTLDVFALQTTYSVVPTINIDTYIGSNLCILKGGIWVMNKSAFYNVYNKIINILENEMIAKNRIDNEQIALTVLYQMDSSLFKIHHGVDEFNDILLHYFREC